MHFKGVFKIPFLCFKSVLSLKFINLNPKIAKKFSLSNSKFARKFKKFKFSNPKIKKFNFATILAIKFPQKFSIPKHKFALKFKKFSVLKLKFTPNPLISSLFIQAHCEFIVPLGVCGGEF